MMQQKIDRIKTWAVGLRLIVDDPLPRWVTIVSIEGDFTAFVVEWEGGEIEKLTRDEIDGFQSEREAHEDLVQVRRIHGISAQRAVR